MKKQQPSASEMLSGHPTNPRDYRNQTTNPRNADGFLPQQLTYSNPYGDSSFTGVIPGAALTYARRTPELNPLALRPGEADDLGDPRFTTSIGMNGGPGGDPQAMRKRGMNTSLGAMRQQMGRA